MTEEKNSKALKILTAILTLGIIALGIYTVRFYTENQKTITRLEDEKSALEGDLNELIVKYDVAIAENDVMSKDLFEAKMRIEYLLDSIQNIDKTSYTVIRNFRNQIKKLEQEKNQLFRTVDSLSRQNELLASAVKSTSNQLQQKTVYADSLKEENQILNTMVAEGARLQITRLNAEGIIVKRSGDLVNTQRHRRADKIRTCFSISKNLISEKGDRIFYVQVINPQNNILGKGDTQKFGDEVLVYSESTKILYENEDLDVCILVDADKNKIVSGTYVVNVFAENNLISSTTFDLK